MPQVPIILPLIVLGITVGSLIKAKGQTLSKKRLFSASVASGLLNTAHAYALFLMFPPQATARVTFALRTVSEPVYLSASFATGFLVVVAVLGIGMVYARFRRGKEPEEEPQLSPAQESELISG